MKTLTPKEKGRSGGVSAKLRKLNGACNGSLSAVLRDPVHSQLRLKSILVPIDFSEPSKNALEYALPFLEQFGAKLTLMHVVEPLPVPAFMTSFPPPIEKDKDIASARGHLEN